MPKSKRIQPLLLIGVLPLSLYLKYFHLPFVSVFSSIVVIVNRHATMNMNMVSFQSSRFALLCTIIYSIQ